LETVFLFEVSSVWVINSRVRSEPLVTENLFFTIWPGMSDLNFALRFPLATEGPGGGSVSLVSLCCILSSSC